MKINSINIISYFETTDLPLPRGMLLEEFPFTKMELFATRTAVV